jgi:FMN-dependent NADH-azoreductase
LHGKSLSSSPRTRLTSTQLSNYQFINQWKTIHPNDTITYRDIGLYPVPFVTEDWIAAAFTPSDQHTPELAAAIQISDEFLAADRYVFSVPMYNLSIPANFKAYLDQIVRAGRTFSVDEAGYKGLVHNKKMTIIIAQGGAYPEGSPTHAYDLQTPYLKQYSGRSCEIHR